MSVLILETGPRFDPATDYPQTEVDWELRDFPEKPGSRREVLIAPGQAPTKEEPLLVCSSRGGGRQAGIGEYGHVCGVGGSILHFTGEAHRLHPHSRLKSRFGVGADWPIEYADLEPYHVRAEELIGVAMAPPPLAWVGK